MVKFRCTIIFLDLSVSTHTRGYINCINIPVLMPISISLVTEFVTFGMLYLVHVVEASSLDCCNRLLNQVDLLQFTVLL